MNLNIFNKHIIIIEETVDKVEKTENKEEWYPIQSKKTEAELVRSSIILTEANRQLLIHLRISSKIKNLKLCTNNCKTRR